MSAKMRGLCYWLLMALLAVAFYARPSWGIVIWGAIGVSSATTILIGVRLHRPRRRLPWVLQAMAVLAFCAGDTTYNVLTDVLGWENPFPSVADAFYLAGFFPLLAAGLYGLSRCGGSRRDRASMQDALTLAAGVALLSWIFLIDPYVRDPTLPFWEKAISIAYPVYDVLVLAIVARLLVSARRTPASLLLAHGGGGLLVADVLYGLSQLNGSWQVGGPVDFGWILFYVLWGGAALHPSMATLTEPRVLRPREISGRRLLLLSLSSLIAPVVLLAEAARGSVRDGAVIAVLCMVMFVLVLARLAGVVSTHRQALSRERALRRAGATLVSATGADEVELAVRNAVAELLPPGARHCVVLTLANSQTTSERKRTSATETTDPRLLRSDVIGTELCYTRALTSELRAQLENFEVTLRCPLALDDKRSGGPLVGALYVGAPDVVLAGLETMIEILAGQAALALERISLGAEINRRRSEEYFRTLVQNATDVILILDEDDTIRYASPSAARVFSTDELAGSCLLDFVHPEDRTLAGEYLNALKAGNAGGESAGWRIVIGARGIRNTEISFQDLRADSTVGGIVATLRDVTERRRLEGELTHRAFYDSLTGMANRVLFQDRTQQAVARAARTGGLVGVLFIDLDDFKAVNDTLGHETGDELLVNVGARLKVILREHDTVARLGGDEFAALVEDATTPAEVEEVAERIIEALTRPFRLQASLVGGMASIGVATNADAGSAQDLLRQADLALYVAKGAGKGQWRRYQSALHTSMLERLEVRAGLDRAIADSAFVLHYQPIVELDDGATVGFEALVRWRHPERGIVPPGQFIDVAEESGLIVAIGSWVLEQAIATASDWCRMLPAQRQPYMSVNVSARQFRTPGFVDQVRHEVERHGLAPTQLMLEITESLLLRDDEQVWTDLHTLREMGIRVAIDDFGTGYSSLSYLRQVPIDVVKIDRSFTQTVGSSTQQRALVDGIVRLAHTLGLEVVAEGIEQPVERAVLRDVGCPLGQGYLFARPMSYGDAVQWLQAALVAA